MISRLGLFLACALGAAGCVEEPVPQVPPLPAAPPPAAQVGTPIVAEREAAPPDPSPVDEKAEVEDESEDDDHLPDAPATARKHGHSPALALDDAAFARAVRGGGDPSALGTMSVGRPNAGILLGGVQMPEGAGWRRIDPGHEWGTQETIDGIARAVDRVRAKFPDTQPLAIGHISAKSGGPLSPHKSHQAGRDVDIGLYYTTNAPWFARGTAQNLDRARTWELVKAFADDDVEWIFLDTQIQRMLRDYALSHGEDRELVDRLIQVGSSQKRTIVHHVPGHMTHLHVRFTSPIACEVGARAAPFFRAEIERAAMASRSRPAPAARGSKAAPAAEKLPDRYFEHHVRPGDTLYRLAARYGVTVEAIQQANGLKGFALKAKSVLRIPKP